MTGTNGINGTNGTKPKQQHWVALAGPNWGHNKSLVQLSSNLLLRDESLLITIALHQSCVAKCEAEKQRCLQAQSNQKALKRFNIVGLEADDGYKLNPIMDRADMPVLKLFDQSAYAFNKTWKELCTPGDDEKVLPTKLVTDLFLIPDYNFVRSTMPSIKVLVWFSTNFITFWQHYAPRKIGGDGDFIDYVNEQWQKEDDKSKWNNDLETYYVHLHSNRGSRIIKVPGLPEYYEYEYTPTHLPIPPALCVMWETSRKQLMQQADGVLFASDAWYEPEASKAVTDWYEGASGKRAFGTGFPLLIEEKQPSSIDAPSAAEEEVVAFLNKFDEKSVLYISFGTAFFPLNNIEAFQTMVDVLLTSKRPFIMSEASQMFGFQKEEFERKTKAAREQGLVYYTDWIPQTTVLRHKSTAAFVTHCGWNSTSEAIFVGLPTICWPMLADQPSIAMKQTLELDTSWELLEVRGQQVKDEQPRRKLDAPLQGTPEALRSEFERVFTETEKDNPVGIRKRKNMQKLSERLRESLKKGGDTWNSLGEILAS